MLMCMLVKGHVPSMNQDYSFNPREKGGIFGLHNSQILTTKTLSKTKLLTNPSASNHFPINDNFRNSFRTVFDWNTLDDG